MARSSFMLVAAIAAAFLAQSALGQFPSIPKITLPKMPKNDAPANPSTPDGDDPVSGTSADTSSPVSGDDSMRGRAIQGAKITFSNNPDGSNPKSSFSSSEYIYGRLDLGGKTLYDAFGFKNLGDAKFYYVSYHLSIFPPGKEPWEHDWHNGRSYTLITKDDAQKTYWNFDVLPDPAKASTLSSAIEDDLDYYKFVSGMYPQVRDVDSARSLFPQSGPYIVDVTIFGNSYDDWGKNTGKSEDYPTAVGRFTFNFSGSDGQTLVANSKKAVESIEAAKNRREMYRAMPDWWSKAWTPTDPKLAPARLVPMIKGFIGQWNLTYMKHMIVQFTGPLWVIEKNSLGIPEYRMAKPYIYVIYRDPKDNSCQVGALYMRESYSGAGTYGAPYLGGIRDVQYIDCAVVR